MMEYNTARWNFIEQYHPNYYSDERVLLHEILFRYLDDDEVAEEDQEWIRNEFKNRAEIEQELRHIEKALYSEAWDNYQAELCQETSHSSLV